MTLSKTNGFDIDVSLADPNHYAIYNLGMTKHLASENIVKIRIFNLFLLNGVACF